MANSGFKIVDSFIGQLDHETDWLTIPNSGTGATATASADDDDNIDTLTLVTGGESFTTIPTVTITNDTIKGDAVVKAVVVNGVVTDLILVSGGTTGFYDGVVAVVFTTGGFSLPESFPDELMTFLHLDFNLSDSAAVNVFKNGVAYPLNNNAPIVGVAFRSLPISKGDVFQFQTDGTVTTGDQTLLQFTLSLET